MHTMQQVCRDVGMPYETLKFYCNQGLVPYDDVQSGKIEYVSNLVPADDEEGVG
ncbi:MAG: hypothetical protein IJT01_12710 [Selenomonadaceae bacterium]|nr:hypothetical protein [Selenomonadaceae bacterium]